MRDFLSHGRVLMALLAGSMTAAAQAALHVPHAWRPLLIASLGTFVIYNLNHLWDEREDEVNAPARRAWRARFVSLWRGLMALATVSGLVLAGSGGQRVLLLTLILVAIGLAYSIPWPIPAKANRRPSSEPLPTPCISSSPPPGERRGKGGEERLWDPSLRLKGKVGLNLALIGAGWALTGVGLPLAETSAPLTLQAALMALWIAGISGILATVFDLRDLPGDARAGLGTLAVLLGPAKARRFLMGWCALSAATIVGAVALGFFQAHILIAMLAPGAAFVWIARWPPGGSTPGGYTDGLLLAEITISWLTTLVLRMSA